jgi:hypothetical protein
MLAKYDYGNSGDGSPAFPKTGSKYEVWLTAAQAVENEPKPSGWTRNSQQPESYYTNAIIADEVASRPMNISYKSSDETVFPIRNN